MKATIKISLTITIVIFLTILGKLTLATDSEFTNLTIPMINPDSLYYPLKRIWEKGWEKFFFSKSNKVFYEKKLLKERLEELKFVVENKILSEIEHSSQRFAFQAGVLTDNIVMLQNNREQKSNLLKEFGQYSLILGHLRDKYPANSSFWMLIQHDINTLKTLSEKIK